MNIIVYRLPSTHLKMCVCCCCTVTTGGETEETDRGGRRRRDGAKEGKGVGRESDGMTSQQVGEVTSVTQKSNR